MSADTSEAHYAAASYAQERVWLASAIAPDGPLYHVTEEFTLHAGIAQRRILEAFGVVAARHESLRTAFLVDGGALMQVVRLDVDLSVHAVDLRGEDPAAQQRLCEETAVRLVFEPFDLGRAPLWRAAVLRVADDGWHVVFVAHCAVFDAESGLNLHAELTELCAASEQDRDAKLPDLPVRYSQYAQRQRARIDGAEGRALLDHWAERLRGLPSVHALPLDRPRPARRTFAGADVRAALPGPALRAMPTAAREYQVSEYAVLLAAYTALLHRRSGRSDIVVGVPAAGRDGSELRPLIGMFVNMLVLRVDVGGDPSFAQLLGRVSERIREAHDHQELPFQTAVEQFCGSRPVGVAPLYQLAFNLLTTRGFGPASTTAEDELLLEVAGDTVRLEYNTALFDAATAQGLLDDYLAVLSAGLADPATPLSELPVSSRPRRTPTEVLVTELWREVLRRDEIGLFDDFFSLGGHSLQAVRVLSALGERCGVQPALHDFFADPTAAGLALEIDRLLVRRNP